MLSDSTKQLIDGLSLDELEFESKQGRHSRFNEQGQAYVAARSAKVTREAESQNTAQNLQLAEEANRISKEANAIAKESKDTAKLSYRLAVLAVVISLLALVAQWFKS